jgi:hypothetical protein
MPQPGYRNQFSRHFIKSKCKSNEDERRKIESQTGFKRIELQSGQEEVEQDWKKEKIEHHFFSAGYHPDNTEQVNHQEQGDDEEI